MQWDSDELPGRDDILMSKRRRLAELEASGNTFIDIQGVSYTRNDLILAFDDILSDDSLHYHLHVRNDSALLHFLETGVYTSGTKFLSQAIYDDADFRKWLSPRYAAAFALALQHAITRYDAASMAPIFGERIKPDADNELQAWEPVRKQLVKAIEYFESCLESFSYPDQQDFIMSLGFMSFLQLLKVKPAHLFYEETEEYTRLLHNVACEMPTIGGKYCIFYNLLNLDLYPALKEKCRKNYNNYPVITAVIEGFPDKWALMVSSDKANELLQRNESSGCSGYAVAILSIIGWIIIITGLNRACENQTTTSKKYDIPKFTIPKIEVPYKYDIPELKIDTALIRKTRELINDMERMNTTPVLSDSLLKALEKRGDSLKRLNIVSDSLMSASDSVMSANDSVKSANDSVKSANDSVKSANDSVKSANDSVMLTNDSVKSASDSVKSPLGAGQQYYFKQYKHIKHSIAMNSNEEQLWLRMSNLLFEMEQKCVNKYEDKIVARLHQRMMQTLDDAGYVVRNPLGEIYDDTRTDVEASICRDDDLSETVMSIRTVMKPVVYRKSANNTLVMVQRGAVIVS
jgi:hypothetical protein